MNMVYETIKKLCNSQNMAISQVEKELGLGSGSIGKWKQNTPKADTLYKVAEFFSVSVEYLLTGKMESIPKNNSIFNNNVNNNKHSTITIQNGSTHTRELTELESELMKITSELPTKEKIKLVDYTYQLTDKKED